MPKKPSIKGKIVLDYLKRFPKVASNTLAIKIYNENIEVFTDKEQVRNSLRYYRGQNGEKNRNRVNEKEFISKPSEFYNPYGLPETDENEYLPYVLPKNCNNILMLCDIHVPYHNIGALTAALDYGKENKINTILLDGDIFDFYGVSTFEKDPRKRRFADEIEDCKEFLRVLRQHFPDTLIYYKWGNHEVRWERFLKLKAPELLDMTEFHLSTIFRFGELRINEIEDKDIIHAGKLSILHGHEFGRSVFSPVNPARGYYMRAKENMIGGHNHRTSEHTESSLNGDVVTCWSVGCLCELHPDYMPINKWNHGFAHIQVKDNGDFTVKNLRIIEGKVV